MSKQAEPRSDREMRLTCCEFQGGFFCDGHSLED